MIQLEFILTVTVPMVFPLETAHKSETLRFKDSDNSTWICPHSNSSNGFSFGNSLTVEVPMVIPLETAHKSETLRFISRGPSRGELSSLAPIILF